MSMGMSLFLWRIGAVYRQEKRLEIPKYKVHETLTTISFLGVTLRDDSFFYC